MKAFKLLLGGLAAMLLLVNCDNNKEDGLIPTEREQLQLSTEIATVDLTGIETKAGEIKGFDNKTFKLIVKDNNGNPTDVTSIATTASSGADKKALVTNLTPPLYWDDLGGTTANLKLVGVYPLGTSISKSGDKEFISWEIFTPQTLADYEEKNDLMLAHTPEYKYAKPVAPGNLVFNHVMTKITLQISGSKFSAAELEAAVVRLNNMPVGTGTVSLLPESGVYKYANPTPLATVTPANLGPGTYAAIVYPFSADAGSQIATLEVKGNTYKVNLLSTPTTKKEFKAGYNHIFNVAINKTGVSVTAQVKDWDTETINIESKLEFNIADISITGTTDTKITAGSKLYVNIGKDLSNNPKEAIYEAKDNGSGGIKWTSTDSIYWDDLDKVNNKYDCNQITAMLVIGGDANNTNGDSIFISPSKALGEDIVSYVSLNPFSHPLAKFTISVTTSTDDDKIDLGKITSIDFPSGWMDFTISDHTKVKETTDVAVVKPLTGHQFVTFACPSKTVLIDGTLCSITVADGSNTNVYNVKLDAAKTFTAGNHYQYTVKITKTNVSFTGSVVDWEDKVEDDEIKTGL